MPDTRQTLEFSPTCDTVRKVLEDLRTGYFDQNVSENLRGTAELVLAEALNNITEHATAGQGDVRVRLTLTYALPFLAMELCDNGTPMPNLLLPKGVPPRVDTTISDLPEGGFGWHLIRTLTQDLEYWRKDGWNCLRFRLSDDHAD